MLNWFIFIFQQGSNPVAAAATAAVQNIVTLLNQSLDKGQGQSSGQRPSMDSEMARSIEIMINKCQMPPMILKCNIILL